MFACIRRIKRVFCKSANLRWMGKPSIRMVLRMCVNLIRFKSENCASFEAKRGFPRELVELKSVRSKTQVSISDSTSVGRFSIFICSDHLVGVSWDVITHHIEKQCSRLSGRYSVTSRFIPFRYRQTDENTPLGDERPRICMKQFITK
jgi:hypothetical protein